MLNLELVSNFPPTPIFFFFFHFLKVFGLYVCSSKLSVMIHIFQFFSKFDCFGQFVSVSISFKLGFGIRSKRKVLSVKILLVSFVFSSFFN